MPFFQLWNGFTISYPFWHQNQLLEHCGYPGFNVSRHGQNPVLHLSDKIYHIRSTNPSKNSLVISRFDPKDVVTCPGLHQDFALPAFSLFNYSVLHTKMLRFFYNCTLFPPSLPSIACLQHNAKKSYVFIEEAIPEFDWNNYCESTESVPVIKKAVHGALSDVLAGALQQGFELTWHQPDVACRSCEATGGLCGYMISSNELHKNFFCRCHDGKHSINCHDNGKDLIKFGPNYTAIGALFFGNLIVAATVFYLIQQKRVDLCKPVSQ